MLHNDSRSLVALPWFSSGIKVIHQTETASEISLPINYISLNPSH